MNPNVISSDTISINKLITETLIMLKSLTTKGSAVIITNNTINEKHMSRAHQL